MNALRFFASLTAAVAALSFAVPAGAAPPKPRPKPALSRFTHVGVYLGRPNLQATADMINAGGGAGSFDSTKLLALLAGSATAPELKSLTAKFGGANVKSFLDVFEFVVSDAVNQATAARVSLPPAGAPAPDGKTLATTLYGLGTTPSHTYDVEYMLDGLVSHPIHVTVMRDIDARYGVAADANYHAVLSQAMADLKAAYGI